MAINLLGGITNPFQTQAPATGGMSVYKPPAPQPTGTVGMNTPKGTQYVANATPTSPMGVTAKTPTASMPSPTTTLPKTQQNPVTAPTPLSSPVTQPAPTPNTYSGLLGQAVSTAQAGAPQANQYAQNAAQYGAGSIPVGQNAADIASDYGKRIADIGTQGAKFQAGQLTTGTSPVAEGNAAVTAQTTAAQQQALAQGEQAALQGTGQQLTAQQQAATASQNAASVPLSQYGTQVGALQNAYGSAKPELGSIGQVPFSPLNQEQGQVLGANQPGGLQAAGNLLGQFAGAQAAGAAPGQAQATNIQSSGTAVTGANAKGLADSIQQETVLNTAASNATALGRQVADALTKSGLDLTNSTDANALISNLQRRLGNDKYNNLLIAVNDARSAYANILQTSGAATPTEAGNMANANISENMSPNMILSAIDQLSKGVMARQQSQHQQTQQYQSQLQGSGTTVGGGGSGGGGIVQTSAGAVNTSWD